MYSKQEASAIRHAFWTALGQYMAPVLSSEGERINWLNYKTGKKNIQFKLLVENKSAFIGIEISHNDAEIQQLHFEFFVSLKKLLHEYLGEEWFWQLHRRDESGKMVSRIYTTLDGVTLFNKEDWPTIISFFKPRLIALDEFWNTVKDALQV